jgi:hypothetical protein
MKITQKKFEVENEFLKNNVKNYWIFEVIADHSATEKLVVPPLGFPCMHFHLGNYSDFYSRENYNLCSLVIGQLKTHIQLNPSHGIKLLAVNFKPYGFYNLFGLTPPGKNELSYDSTLEFGKEQITSLISDLTQKLETPQFVTTIENFILSNQKKEIKKFEFLDSIVDQMIASNGLLDVNLFIKKKCSIRTLQRYFGDVIGVSPKTFTKILRHKYILKLMYDRPDLQWNDFVFQGYYFDYSHFKKDFIAFSTLNPIEYISAKKSIVSGLLR